MQFVTHQAFLIDVMKQDASLLTFTQQQKRSMSQAHGAFGS